MTIPARPIVSPVSPNIDMNGPTWRQDLQRFIRQVSTPLNSLALSGILTIGGAGGGPGAISMSHLIYFGNGAPSASLGMVGTYYVDLLTGNVYENT